jgi:hypothetical protein
MEYDKKNADLFLQNFKEAYRSAKLLISSYTRILPLMPLKGEQFQSLNEDDLDRFDAFRVRYCDLQDSLGNKTFRSILVLEEEIPGSNLDILNKMEKRQIIESFGDWKLLRNIRNLFSHDYPETEDDKADALNEAFSHTVNLVTVVDNVSIYMLKKELFSMNDFPFLIKK